MKATTIRTSNFTARVTFRFRNAAGDLETKTFEQDVTDEIAEGTDEEELVDRIFWKQIDGKFAAIDFLFGGVVSE